MARGQAERKPSAGSGAKTGRKHLKALVLPSLLSLVLLSSFVNTPVASASLGETILSLKLAAMAQADSGRFGMYLKVLETGEEAGYQADKPFYAASCYKLFLVMYVYESAAAGRINLNSSITCQDADYSEASGAEQMVTAGTSLTTRRLCEYAIIYSDNVAANMLKRTYGFHAFRDYARSLGCPVTGGAGNDQTTAREMGIILERARDFAAGNPLGEEVISCLCASKSRSRIPAGIPSGVKVGNKTGDYDSSLNDAAIIFLDGDTTYLLCILSAGASGDSVHVATSRWIYEFMYYLYGAGNSQLPV
jgi:beta-lactamase class A